MSVLRKMKSLKEEAGSISIFRLLGKGAEWRLAANLFNIVFVTCFCSFCNIKIQAHL